ncbi:unnamed protein product [Ranitomeya imitator]|uniref:Homologous-pairing protein 2 homolog n=1 Tax=Ranitomeya imitator TaxID=111125 RepID=A0ABN9MQV6_9NEOB|nr:unnamed protein product [Ranitomeya imitator]
MFTLVTSVNVKTKTQHTYIPVSVTSPGAVLLCTDCERHPESTAVTSPLCSAFRLAGAHSAEKHSAGGQTPEWQMRSNLRSPHIVGGAVPMTSSGIAFAVQDSNWTGRRKWKCRNASWRDSQFIQCCQQCGHPEMSKSKDAAASSLILKYLNDQNRPYSTQDVFSNLQRDHGLGKTAVVKAMELLSQQGKIKEKVYGKQKIYFADQDQFPNVSDTELKSLDVQISELSNKLQSVQQSCRQLETELKDLNSAMTTEEMMKEIKELTQECSRHKEKLQKIKSATNHVTPEEKESTIVRSFPCVRYRQTGKGSYMAVYSERKQYSKEWRKRKRMATDIFEAILEGYPKSKKQFFEEVGIETDEEHNVTVPDV